MSLFKLNWRGPKVLSKVRRCERDGINVTMTQAVIEAKGTHRWQNVTGTLERSIQIVQPAMKKFRGFIGRWGTKGVEYGIFLELKTEWMWLRPAADKVYPNLARNIKRCMTIGR